MSKKGTIIGIIIAIAAVAGMLTYTNIFELAKPGIESGVDTAKDTLAKVEGKDVVDKIGEAQEKIKNTTDQIVITNPLEPKK